MAVGPGVTGALRWEWCQWIHTRAHYGRRGHRVTENGGLLAREPAMKGTRGKAETGERGETRQDGPDTAVVCVMADD